MCKFLPHLIYLTSLILLWILGYMAISSEMGLFFGSLFGASFDPILLISAVLIGVIFTKQKLFNTFSISARSHYFSRSKCVKFR